MRTEKASLADLREAVKPLLPPTVIEVSFDDDKSHASWVLHGEATGIRCEVEHLSFWMISLDEWYVEELWPRGETRLATFLTSFDLKPIQLVTVRKGSRVVGSWLRFADGLEFEDPTWFDKRITRSRRYSLEVTPWVAGAVRMDLIVDS
jgi:hypothetical protein